MSPSGGHMTGPPTALTLIANTSKQMTIQTTSTLTIPLHGGAAIHPGWVRIGHWINAIAMVVMIGSGWQIYNASPLFAFTFPRAITLGDWLGGALRWHFAAMWLLVVNGMQRE
jgi:thiosulfate reductase cytochrome b subunit